METTKNYRTQDQKLYQYELWLENQFDDLAQLEDNWDEHDSKKPTDLTLIHAKHVINTLLGVVTSAGYQWHPPFISSDEDGNVTAVWYDGERQLHFQMLNSAGMPQAGTYSLEKYEAETWKAELKAAINDDVDFQQYIGYLSTLTFAGGF